LIFAAAFFFSWLLFAAIWHAISFQVFLLLLYKNLSTNLENTSFAAGYLLLLA